MRLLYTSDLHGDEGHYSRLAGVVGSVRPDVLVLGGDLLPDDSALVREEMGKHQPMWVSQQFRQIISKIREGAARMEVLVIFGNHDWGSSATAMSELAGEGLVRILDHKSVVELGGVRFVGYSYTPPTPWFVKDFERLDMPGDVPPLLGGARWDPRFRRASANSASVIYGTFGTIADDLKELPSVKSPWVFVAHAPPHGTKLDQSFSGNSFGSRAILAAIERTQPTVSLHGHIHESPTVTGAFKQSIGTTIAVNAGQGNMRLQYAVIEIDSATGRVGDLQHGHQA